MSASSSVENEEDIFDFDRRCAFLEALLTQDDQKLKNAAEFNNLTLDQIKNFSFSQIQKLQEKIDSYKIKNYTEDDWIQEGVENALNNGLESKLVNSGFTLQELQDFQMAENSEFIRFIERSFQMEITGSGSTFLKNYQYYHYVRGCLSDGKLDEELCYVGAVRWGHWDALKEEKIEQYIDKLIFPATINGNFDFFIKIVTSSKEITDYTIGLILYGAAKFNHLNIINWVFSESGWIFTEKNLNSGLEGAIIGGHFHLFKMLWEKIVKYGFFPDHNISDIIIYNRVQILEWISNSEFSEFITDEQNFEFSVMHGHVRIFYWLRSKSQNFTLSNLFRSAIECGKTDFIKLLYNGDISPKRWYRLDIDNFLNQAIYNDQLKSVKWLLEKYPWTIDYVPFFHTSIRTSSLEIVQIFHDRADKNFDYKDLIDDCLCNGGFFRVLQWLNGMVSNPNYERQYVLAQINNRNQIITFDWLKSKIIKKAGTPIIFPNQDESRLFESISPEIEENSPPISLIEWIIRIFIGRGWSIPWLHLYYTNNLPEYLMKKYNAPNFLNGEEKRIKN